MRIFIAIFSLSFLFSFQTFAGSLCDKYVIDPTLKVQGFNNMEAKLSPGDRIIIQYNEEKYLSPHGSRDFFSPGHFGKSSLRYSLKLQEGELSQHREIIFKANKGYRFTVEAVGLETILRSDSGRRYKMTAKIGISGSGAYQHSSVSLINIARGRFSELQVVRDGKVLSANDITIARDNLCDEDYIHSLEVKGKERVEP
ncbi:MAG: hypothetical protein KDD33_06085 [Bdellovibrionales bacterium]|nr:hypothetical protein [Bdellovibrionales bacterium]